MDGQTIEADRATLRAMRDLGDYQPANLAYDLATLQALEEALTRAEEAEERYRRALEQARDERTEASRMFHEAILGAKAQVIAQYGNNSYAVQAIGLKKKSEYRRPTRRPSPPAA